MDVKKKPIPEGYMRDADDRLVDISMVPQMDIEKDDLVRRIAENGLSVAKSIGTFKRQSMNDIKAFMDLTAEKYGAKLGGIKGNVTMYTFDGQFKLQLAIADRIEFGEQLQAAKAIIDECLADWSQGARPELQAVVSSAFDADKQGKINIRRVLDLRNLNIADDRWKNAMQAINDSLQVTGSKSYIRLYQRNADGGYDPIPLDVAAA